MAVLVVVALLLRVEICLQVILVLLVVLVFLRLSLEVLWLVLAVVVAVLIVRQIPLLVVVLVALVVEARVLLGTLMPPMQLQTLVAAAVVLVAKCLVALHRILMVVMVVRVS
jgi:hypothetical protein